MIRFFFFCCFFFFGAIFTYAQQKPLPNLTVKNFNNKIIISWSNAYQKPITTLNIQRSYDSLKNYKTIGEVLSPQSIENGYVDANPQYNKMYYRIFVAFEGGEYIYSNVARPKKDLVSPNDSSALNFPVTDAIPWLKIIGKEGLELMPDGKPKITYPSQTVYTLKDNNIIISLTNTQNLKYSIKFFDEKDSFLFEIKRVKEDVIIIEKVNFVRSGWYRFELYENQELIENNKFQILKAVKGL